MVRRALVGLSLLAAIASAVVSLLSNDQRVAWVSRPMEGTLIMCDIRDGYAVVSLYSWTRGKLDPRVFAEELAETRNEFRQDKDWWHMAAVHEVLDPGAPEGFCIPGFCYLSVPMPFAAHIYIRALAAPMWFVAIILSIYPGIAFIRGPVRRWRRRRKGLCLKCRYNLTGNVSGVCPECGTKIETPTMSRVGAEDG